jgi:hypothetical protein
MKSAGTHFEQVPKAIVEKILAKQIGPPETDSMERGVAVKASVRQAEALASRLRKV